MLTKPCRKAIAKAHVANKSRRTSPRAKRGSTYNPDAATHKQARRECSNVEHGKMPLRFDEYDYRRRMMLARDEEE